jgi:hypothetical protein
MLVLTFIISSCFLFLFLCVSLFFSIAISALTRRCNNKTLRVRKLILLQQAIIPQFTSSSQFIPLTNSIEWQTDRVGAATKSSGFITQWLRIVKGMQRPTPSAEAEPASLPMAMKLQLVTIACTVTSIQNSFPCSTLDPA